MLRSQVPMGKLGALERPQAKEDKKCNGEKATTRHKPQIQQLCGQKEFCLMDRCLSFCPGNSLSMQGDREGSLKLRGME